MTSSIKEKIRTNFNNAHASYDQHCAIQNAICQQSINLLLKYQNYFSSISDIGCGTGESTIQLINNTLYQKCYAIDFAEKLLSIAEKKIQNNKINFILGDLDKRLFSLSCLDLIFSNMALQWAENLSNTIELFHHYLVSNGILLFSMPIAGNFPEIKPHFKPTLPSQNKVIQTLLKKQFILLEHKIETFPIIFDSQFKLIKSLKETGTNYNKSKNQLQLGLSKRKLNRVFIVSGNSQLTYKIGIFLAKKK